MGNELNRVVYGGGGTDYVHSGIVINEAGEVLMTGGTRSFGGSDYDTWLIKTDSIGEIIWQETYNGISSGGGGGTGVLSFPDGSFGIVGAVENEVTGESDALIMKVDENGNIDWVKKLVATQNISHGFWAGKVLEDGSILAAGQRLNVNTGNQAGWLVKTDENGDTLWTRVYNPSSNTDLLRNMLVLDNGDIVMVGFGRGENSTNQDGWILRVDSLGCLMEGCHTVGINEELGINNDELLLYPNPATDVLNITLTDFSARSSVEVTVVDFSGREVETLRFAQGNTQASIDVSSWPAGIYLLSIRDENGNLVSKRVVRE